MQARQNIAKIDEEYDYLYKILVISAPASGSKSLCDRFTANWFDQDYKRKISSNFCTSSSVSIEGKMIKAQLWDSHYQGDVSQDALSFDLYTHTRNGFFRGPVGCMIVYDISKKTSFEQAKGLLTQLRQRSDRDIVYMLVGNKIDLRHLREVTTEDAKAFADENNMLFIETSALLSYEVELAFNTLLTQIYHVMSKPSADKVNDIDQSTNDFVNTESAPQPSLNNINTTVDYHNATEDELVSLFLKTHKTMREKDKKAGFFGSLGLRYTSSHLDELVETKNVTLEWILSHANEKTGGNRTRRVCYKLKWLNEEGGINEAHAPQRVREVYATLYRGRRPI